MGAELSFLWLTAQVFPWILDWCVSAVSELFLRIYSHTLCRALKAVKQKGIVYTVEYILFFFFWIVPELFLEWESIKM